jgi:hypothetical protein
MSNGFPLASARLLSIAVGCHRCVPGGDATEEPWGARRFFVRDPNGVVVNVVGHPD